MNLEDMQLLRVDPYKIMKNGGSNSVRVVISQLAELQIGDYVKEYKTKEGYILLVPINKG